MKQTNVLMTPANVVYHPALTPEELTHWADYAGCSPQELRAATESVICECHHAALIDLKGAGRHPDVFKLGLGLVVVCYTVESKDVVVRGYAPNLPRDQTPPEDAGRWYGEFEWTCPTEDR